MMLKSERGLGMVEIIVALVVVGFGLTMVMRTLPESNRATTQSRNVTKATNLAQQKLEQLSALNAGAVDLAQGAHTDPNNPIDEHYRRSWLVTDDDPYEGMKRVVVRVRYPTASADSTVTLNSIMSTRW
jgi:type II secretory pathway pseudopilin PulG